MCFIVWNKLTDKKANQVNEDIFLLMKFFLLFINRLCILECFRNALGSSIRFSALYIVCINKNRYFL